MHSNLNLYKKIKFIYIISLISLSFSNVFAETISDKEYYLIDGLIISELSSYDKTIIDSCLSVYHNSNEDTLKIKAVAHICDNITDKSWSKYQVFLHAFILEKLPDAKNEILKKTLTAALVDAMVNLSVMEMEFGNYTKALVLCEESLNYSKDISYIYGLARSYSGIAYSYQLTGDLTKAIYYYKKGSRQYEKIDDELSMVDNILNTAEIYRVQGNIFKAELNINKSIEIIKKQNDLFRLAVSYNNLALIKKSSGNISEAINLQNKSISIYKNTGAKRYEAVSYSNLGDIYFSQKEVMKAKEYYFLSLEMSKKLGLKPQVSFNLSNIAKVYKYNEELDSALLYFNKSLKIELERKDSIGIARCYINIADVYFLLTNFEKSILLNKKGLNIYENLGFKLEYTICKNLLAKVYLKKGKNKIAENYAHSALKSALELGYPKQIQDASLVLLKTAKAKGNFKKALKFYELHIEMRDSLTNLDNKALVIRKGLEANYNEKKYQLEEQKLLDEIKFQEQGQRIKEQKYLAILLSSFLIIIVLIVLWRRSKDAFKIKWLQEDIIKSQMKPHFLFNVLVSIQSLIVQKRDKDAIHYLAEIASYMRSNLNDVSLKSISIEEELKLAEQYLILEKLRFKDKLEFEIINLLSNNELDIKVPPLITQPIIENSVIHGFKNINNAGKITIKTEVIHEKLHITIEDNGIGFKDINKKSSKGLGIVRKRLKLFSSKNQFVLTNKEFGVIAKLIIDTN